MIQEGTLVRIGDAAERLGLSLRTLRHWEEMGLVTPSERSSGGFRLYSEDDLRRLLVVKHMKPLGLTLDEMRELLETLERSREPGALGAAELTQAAGHLRDYGDRCDERIAKLGRYLEQARILRAQIGEQLDRCEAELGGER